MTDENRKQKGEAKAADASSLPPPSGEGREKAKAAATPPEDGPPSPMTLADLDESGGDAGAGSIDMLMDVTLNVRIELGRTHMSVEDILKLGKSSVVTLDKLAGDFVDVLVNDKLVARGEVLILNDNFCVRIAEIVSPEEREDATGL